MNEIREYWNLLSALLLSTWYLPVGFILIGAAMFYLSDIRPDNMKMSDWQTAVSLIGVSFILAGANLLAAQWNWVSLVLTSVITAGISFLIFCHASEMIGSNHPGWTTIPHRERKGFGLLGLILMNVIFWCLAVAPSIPEQVAKSGC